MFTQCPQCHTVFRLGVGDLRRAQGRVRCGECAHVFNALDYLQEDSPAVAPPPPQSQPQPPWLTNSAHNPPRDIESDPDVQRYAAEIEEQERLRAAGFADAKGIGYEQPARDSHTAYDAAAWETQDPARDTDMTNTGHQHPDQKLYPAEEPVNQGAPDHASSAAAINTSQPEQHSDATGFAALPDDADSLDDSFDDAARHAAWTPTGEAAGTPPPPEWYEAEEYTRAADDNDNIESYAAAGSGTDTDAVQPGGWHESDEPASLTVPDFDSNSAVPPDSNAVAAGKYPRWWDTSDAPASDGDARTDSTSIASDDSLFNTGNDETLGDSELPDLDIDFEDEEDESGHGILVVDDDPSPRWRRSESVASAADLQPLVSEPVAAEADNSDDSIDPDIWERIPGIGALADRPMPLPDPADWSPESEDEPKFTLGNDTDDALPAEDDALPLGEGDLEFNVPEDKWDNFFGPVERGPTAVWRPSGLDVAAGNNTDLANELDDRPDSAEPDDADPFANFDAGDTLPPTRVDPAYRERFLQAEEERRDIDADEDDSDDDEIYRVGEYRSDDADAQGDSDWDPDDDDSYGGTSVTAAAYRDAWLDEDPELARNDSDSDRIAAVTGDEDWDEEDDEGEDNSASPDEVVSASESIQVVPPWRDGNRATTATGGGRIALYSVGILVMLLGLAAQLVHYNRDDLAVHPQYGDDLRLLYSLLPFDTDLLPRWPLADYEVRSAEAVTGESGADVLDVRAQLVTTGDQPVGLPLLRVVMLDRWSAPVATRDFRPAEYLLDGPPADGMLQPGQTLTAHLRLIDPGRNAAGFELEICLPRRYTGLECNNQPFR